MLSSPDATHAVPSAAGALREPSVLLASVPFAPLGSPSLGLALLQACLRERHIESRVWHLGLDFAAEVGVSEYRLVADELLFTPDLTGDWLFADALRGQSSSPDAWLRDVFDSGDAAHRKPLRLRCADSDRTRARLLALRARTTSFIDRCAAQILDAAPRVLGLTSVFAQNAAALALAKRVKALAPRTLICLGGANAEGPMGAALFEHFDFLDVVVSGEGELRFPPLVEAWLEGRPLPRLEGVWAREALLEHGTVRATGPADSARCRRRASQTSSCNCARRDSNSRWNCLSRRAAGVGGGRNITARFAD